MDERTKELVALGASVGAHCQPCLDWHLNKAKELGISGDDIQLAIEVGFMVEKGAGNAMRNYASEIIGAPQTQGESCCPGGGSKCCS